MGFKTVPGPVKEELVGSKLFAEKMIEKNLETNFSQLRHELNFITNKTRNMTDYCEKNLDTVIEKLERKLAQSGGGIVQS